MKVARVHVLDDWLYGHSWAVTSLSHRFARTGWPSRTARKPWDDWISRWKGNSRLAWLTRTSRYSQLQLFSHFNVSACYWDGKERGLFAVQSGRVPSSKHFFLKSRCISEDPCGCFLIYGFWSTAVCWAHFNSSWPPSTRKAVFRKHTHFSWQLGRKNKQIFDMQQEQWYTVLEYYNVALDSKQYAYPTSS